MKKILLLGMVSTLAVGANAKSLEERVEALEYAGYDHFLKISGQLETRFDSYSTEVKKSPSTSTPVGKSVMQTWKSWIDLDIESNPSDRLSFYGRLSAAKYNNLGGTVGGAVVPDLESGQVVKDSGAYFTRAFANYKINDSSVFSFGRLPTANGTPYSLTRYEKSGGAYPLLAYNSNLDGIAYTKNISTGENAGLSLRVVYTPWTNLSEGKTVKANGTEFSETANLFAFMAEHNKTGLSFAREMKSVFQFVQGTGIGFNVKNQKLSTLGVAADDGLSDLSLNLRRFVFDFELFDIKRSGFDFAVQVANSTTSQEGYFQLDTTDVGGAKTKYGVLTSDPKEEVHGTYGIMTLRYALGGGKLGFQYAKSSEGAFISDGLTKAPFSIIDGGESTGYHLFYNHAFEGGLKMTVGYIQKTVTKAAPVNGLFGSPVDADIVSKGAYTSFVANF